MKKMLVFDLDGTILNDSYNVSMELIQFIREISKEHLVYIATGRSISDAYRYYKELNLENDIICNNGGLIYNPRKRYL